MSRMVNSPASEIKVCLERAEMPKPPAIACLMASLLPNSRRVLTDT